MAIFYKKNCSYKKDIKFASCVFLKVVVCKVNTVFTANVLILC